MKGWIVAAVIVAAFLFSAGVIVGMWMDMRDGLDDVESTMQGMASWSHWP